MNTRDAHVVPRKVLDWLNLALVVLVILFLMTLTGFVIYATATIARIQQHQIEFVQQQNNAQLCAQHDIIVAVRQIGQKLGLPIQNIVVPDTKGLNCENI